jgi:hypothetical protein
MITKNHKETMAGKSMGSSSTQSRSSLQFCLYVISKSIKLKKKKKTKKVASLTPVMTHTDLDSNDGGDDVEVWAKKRFQ